MEFFPEIPGYRIEKRLIEGRISDIYLGVHEDLDRQVAIQVINPELFRDRRFAESFQRESKKINKFVHPNIANILEASQYNDLSFIVMEYLPLSLREKIDRKFGIIPPGGDIDSLPLREDSGLDDQPLLQLLIKLGEVFDYSHKLGVIHKDIRPDNIRFREDGEPAVVGFFMAKVIGNADILEKMGMIAGTPYYVSPEQALRKPLDGGSDIYSLGVTLHEMITGTLPYNAEEAIAIENQHIMEPVPVLPANLSRFQLLLSRMMAKDKNDRMQNGRELVQFVEEFRFKLPEKPRKTPVQVNPKPTTVEKPIENLISFSDNLLEGLNHEEKIDSSENVREYEIKEITDDSTANLLEDNSVFNTPYNTDKTDNFNDIVDNTADYSVDSIEEISEEVTGKGKKGKEKKVKEKKVKEKKVKEKEVKEKKVILSKDDIKKAALRNGSGAGKKKLNFNFDFQELVRTLLNPRILIPVGVAILLAVVLLWVMSPSSEDTDTKTSGDKTATTDKKNLTKEELAQEEIKFQYQMDMVQRFYKKGDLQKALDKLKGAEKIKQTDQTKQLKVELTQKLSGSQDLEAYTKAIAAGTLPPLEMYLKQFPSGRYVNQVEEQLNRLKEEARIKEEEQARLLATSIKLRSQPKDLTLDDVKAAIVGRGFFEQYYNPKGKFKNKFQIQTINEERVVLDYATGLMWHQSGSEKYFNLDETQKWLEQLNKTGYAGYSDWRFPTLDEAVSLLANSEGLGGLYLSKVFSREQAYIWTCDTFENSKAWAVDFNSGDVNRVDFTFDAYLRPVRPISVKR